MNEPKISRETFLSLHLEFMTISFNFAPANLHEIHTGETFSLPHREEVRRCPSKFHTERDAIILFLHFWDAGYEYMEVEIGTGIHFGCDAELYESL